MNEQNWSSFDSLYAKACKTSQPSDWMEAALAAQQARAALAAQPGAVGERRAPMAVLQSIMRVLENQEWSDIRKAEEAFRLAAAPTEALRMSEADERSEREALARVMADKLMCWRLPADFHPDGGISFKPYSDYDHPEFGRTKHEPFGTNLFTHEQAVAMLLDIMPPALSKPAQDAVDAELLESLAVNIEAIDVIYRGDPCYEHDGYWMRREAAREVRDFASRLAAISAKKGQP